MTFDSAAFIEELIQLQLKHKISFTGYDFEFCTVEEGIAAAKKYPDRADKYLVTENNIRKFWEREI